MYALLLRFRRAAGGQPKRQGRLFAQCEFRIGSNANKGAAAMVSKPFTADDDILRVEESRVLVNRSLFVPPRRKQYGSFRSVSYISIITHVCGRLHPRNIPSSFESSSAPCSALTNNSSSSLSDRSRPKDGATPTARKTTSPTSLNDLLGLADDSRTLEKLGGDYGRMSPPHYMSCIVSSLTVGVLAGYFDFGWCGSSDHSFFYALFELGRIPPRLYTVLLDRFSRHWLQAHIFLHHQRDAVPSRAETHLPRNPRTKRMPHRTSPSLLLSSTTSPVLVFYPRNPLILSIFVFRSRRFSNYDCRWRLEQKRTFADGAYTLRRTSLRHGNHHLHPLSLSLHHAAYQSQNPNK